MRNSKHLLNIIIISLIIISTIFIYAINISKRNEGHFNYILDDAYIHMAIAKNLSQYGVWGTSQFEFTSSSSSLLWTILLSCLFKAGMNPEFIPLSLNLISILLLSLLFYNLMIKEKINHIMANLLTILTIFLIPSFYLIFTGLEHSLQCLACLSFIYFGSLYAQKNTKKHLITLITLSSIITSIRYEGLFLIFALFCSLILAKKIKSAFIIMFSSLIPILIFGLISISKGWYFLPNSVYLKGNRANSIFDFARIFFDGLEQIRSNTHLLILSILILIIALYFWETINKIHKNILTVFFITYLCHMFLARSGNFITNPHLVRYDAYLTLIAIYLLILLLNDIKEEIPLIKELSLKTPLLITLIIILAFPLFKRASSMNLLVTDAAHDVYRQQYQLGLFIKNFYNNSSVAINDIGYPSYLSQIHLSDALALADKEIGKLILENKYNPKEVDKILRKRDVKGIMIFEPIFYFVNGKHSALPQSWIKVAVLHTPNNKIAAYHSISFFAINKKYADYMRGALKIFKSKLPKESKLYLMK